MYDVAIIGCGVVGAATAYALARYDLDVLILERDNDVANGTSKANSAILHAGYDPTSGSLMAKLNVKGADMAKEICTQLDVLRRECGSLDVAFCEDEINELKTLYERGLKNGVRELAILNQAELRAIEPYISENAIAALYAPTASIVNPWELTLAMAEIAVINGARLQLDTEVSAIEKIPEGFLISTEQGDFSSRYIVNAAGVHSDRIHNMIAKPSFTIRPDRGEYYLLDKSEGFRAQQVIFQCPSPQGKGTLVAPTVHGNLIVGPNNEKPRCADDTVTTAAGLAGIRIAAQKSVPSINFRENIRNFSGVRAASDRDDFIIEEAKDVPGLIDLAGIKSPGLTAAPAIGVMAADLLSNAGLDLKERQEFINERKKIRFNELSSDEKAELIKKNPAYGHVICRCVTITEGEILDALKSPIPPRSVDAVKRHCNAGMGRCQGGFCGPRVLEILAREQGVSPLEITQGEPGSKILVGETKEGAK